MSEPVKTSRPLGDYFRPLAFSRHMESRVADANPETHKVTAALHRLSRCVGQPLFNTTMNEKTSVCNFGVKAAESVSRFAARAVMVVEELPMGSLLQIDGTFNLFKPDLQMFHYEKGKCWLETAWNAAGCGLKNLGVNAIALGACFLKNLVFNGLALLRAVTRFSFIALAAAVRAVVFAAIFLTCLVAQLAGVVLAGVGIGLYGIGLAVGYGLMYLLKFLRLAVCFICWAIVAIFQAGADWFETNVLDKAEASAKASSHRASQPFQSLQLREHEDNTSSFPEANDHAYSDADAGLSESAV